MSNPGFQAFFRLPEDILRCVLREWIDFRALPKVDLACCNHSFRRVFLNALTDSVLAKACLYTYNQALLCLQWLHSRKVSITKVAMKAELLSRFTDTLYSVMMSNTTGIDLHGSLSEESLDEVLESFDKFARSLPKLISVSSSVRTPRAGLMLEHIATVFRDRALRSLEIPGSSKNDYESLIHAQQWSTSLQSLCLKDARLSELAIVQLLSQLPLLKTFKLHHHTTFGSSQKLSMVLQREGVAATTALDSLRQLMIYEYFDSNPLVQSHASISVGRIDGLLAWILSRASNLKLLSLKVAHMPLEILSLQHIQELQWRDFSSTNTRVFSTVPLHSKNTYRLQSLDVREGDAMRMIEEMRALSSSTSSPLIALRIDAASTLASRRVSLFRPMDISHFSNLQVLRWRFFGLVAESWLCILLHLPRLSSLHWTDFNAYDFDVLATIHEELAQDPSSFSSAPMTRTTTNHAMRRIYMRPVSGVAMENIVTQHVLLLLAHCFPRLQTLHLRNCDVTDDDLYGLILPRFQRLRTLDLTMSCDVLTLTPPSHLALPFPYSSSLRTLFLGYDRGMLSPHGLLRLVRNIPSLIIVALERSTMIRDLVDSIEDAGVVEGDKAVDDDEESDDVGAEPGGQGRESGIDDTDSIEQDVEIDCGDEVGRRGCDVLFRVIGRKLLEGARGGMLMVDRQHHRHYLHYCHGYKCRSSTVYAAEQAPLRPWMYTEDGLRSERRDADMDVELSSSSSLTLFDEMNRPCHWWEEEEREEDR